MTLRAERRKPAQRKRTRRKPGAPHPWARRIARAILLTILLVLGAVASLRWIDPPTSSVMVQENIRAWRDGAPFVSHHWVSWNEISPQLPLAVIAAEDQRFPDHHGIDVIELRKAIRGGGQRGASTISQQVAKNLFLWQGRSYLRKVLEAPLALFIDLAWGKRRVLEVYLNIAYFGGNIYGAGAASEAFFDKPASALNRYEAARLAATLPNPDRYSAVHASSHTMARQRWILGQMEQLGGVHYLDRL